MPFQKIKNNILAGVARQLRADADRRGGSAVPTQAKRRIASDPKGLSCGVEFKTNGSIMELEEWLELNSEGKFTIGIEDIDDKRESKTLIIMFQFEQDKAKFLAKHSGRINFADKKNI
jgi:hypothetical protein